MNSFARLSIAAFSVQIGLIVLTLLTGIGDGVLYWVYGSLFIVIDAVVRIPEIDRGDSLFVLFLLLCLPALFYSLLFSGIVLLIQNRRKSAEKS